MFDTEKVIKIIEEIIGTEVTNYSMNPFNHGLNSLGVLKLITMIEDGLNIEIDDNDLTVENMSSIDLILEMVKKYEN
jgi:acyl carrier protein